MRRPGSWSSVRYGRWDGTQEIEVDISEIFDEIADALLYHGDPMSALRELMNRGMRTKDGGDILGLKEVLERLKQRRSELFGKYDPSGKASEIDNAIRSILESERRALEEYLEAASNSKDAPRIAQAEELYLNDQLTLDSLGPSIASKIQSLGNYDFLSPTAKRDFDDLRESLEREFVEGFFESAKNSLSTMTPEDLENFREMIGALNSLIEAHNANEDTSEAFEAFMDRYGGSFPPGIANTQELLDHLLTQMAAASLAFGAMSQEQQMELANLAQNVNGDLDLSWAISQLMRSLSPMMDSMRFDPRSFRGSDPMSIGQAGQVLDELSQLDSIESYLRSIGTPGDLSRLDFDQISELLGEKEASSLRRLSELTKQLEDAGLIGMSDERLTLSAGGLRAIGQKMLQEVFDDLDASRLGGHDLKRRGVGVDKDFETKPYEFGDPLNLSLGKTLANTIVRQRGGLPLKVEVEDFEIETTEAMVSASTVLCLDLSLSMPLRDNFLAAKKVAVALSTLISTAYPKDYLAIVGFSEVAHVIKPMDLPSVSWDYVYGTNMEDALRQSRTLLRRRSGRKQIILVTDGEPTAHILENGEPFFSYPPARETILATLSEVNRCTKAGITINSFVLDATDYLVDFMNQVAKINRGKVFYSDPSDLGKYVLVDFMAQRTS